MTTSPQSLRIRFGAFEVRLSSCELIKHGIRKIQDQPFQILALLLERPGELVARGKIQDRQALRIGVCPLAVVVLCPL